MSNDDYITTATDYRANCLARLHDMEELIEMIKEDLLSEPIPPGRMHHIVVMDGTRGRIDEVRHPGGPRPLNLALYDLLRIKAEGVSISAAESNAYLSLADIE